MKSVIKDELEKNGVVVCRTEGDSMSPLLYTHRDIVTISKVPPGQRLKKYDIPLYRRDQGNTYVLHRILKVREHDYVICGDNRRKLECGITDDHIVGVLTGIVRNRKELPLDSMQYKLYVFFWCRLHPIRRFFLLVKSVVKDPRKIQRKLTKR